LYLLFVSVWIIVWLSLPMQSIAWKDSSPELCVERDVKPYTLSHLADS